MLFHFTPFPDLANYNHKKKEVLIVSRLGRRTCVNFCRKDWKLKFRNRPYFIRNMGSWESSRTWENGVAT